MTTTDPSAQSDAHGQIALPLADEIAAPRSADAGPAPRPLRRQALLVGFGAASLLWGTWATHAILTLRRDAPHLVKVQLAELVREYVEGEARSGAPSDRITAETAAFLKALNDAVQARKGAGETVLLANAVVGGDVPDITLAVRREVYARVPRPQPGGADGLSPAMQQFFNGQAAVPSHAQGDPGGNGK